MSELQPRRSLDELELELSELQLLLSFDELELSELQPLLSLDELELSPEQLLLESLALVLEVSDEQLSLVPA